MKFHMLASGSKGNAFVLETLNKRILIDCGTTQRYLKGALKSIGHEDTKFDGVLITHLHGDHISQIKMFSKSTDIYAPQPLVVDHHIVTPYSAIEIEGIHILPLATSHDADVSVGYVIEADDKKMVYMTDTGYVKESDIQYMLDADVIVLESNHDPHMLMQTNRPYMTKQRILSDYGHLSNDDAGSVLSRIVTHKTKEVILAHLSEQANSEKVALDTVSKYLNGYKGNLRVAKQFEILSGSVETKGVD